MIVTVDEQGRVALPSPTRPGDSFNVEVTGYAQYLLTRLEQQTERVRLERRDKYLVAVTDHAIIQEVIRKLLDRFP